MITGLESGIGISQAFPNAGTKGATPASVASDTGKFLGELVNKVNELQVKADNSVQNMATGDEKGLHEVMIAMEKSAISFQFLNQVRNKAVEAYQEMMRMQV